MPEWRWPPVPPRGYKVGQPRAGAVVRNLLHELTLPRLTAMRSWGPGGDGDVSELAVGLEVISTGGDAVIGVFFAVPWRRPRPFVCEVRWPPTEHWSQEWQWRE
jgi:hypothetical protein